MNTDAKPLRDFFQRQKAGVLLDAKLIKLKQLVTDATRFGSAFLRPTALDAQFPQSLFESV